MSANAWTEWLHDLLGMSHHNGLFSVGHGQTDTILGGNGHQSLLYFNSPSRVAGGQSRSWAGAEYVRIIMNWMDACPGVAWLYIGAHHFGNSGGLTTFQTHNRSDHG